MSNILKFPTQTSWRKLGETPKVTGYVFVVAERLLNKQRNELTQEEELDLESLKTVFSELSLINLDLVSIISDAEQAGKIDYIEKIILTSILLTIQQIRPDIINTSNKPTINDFVSTEIEKNIIASNLSQPIKTFLMEIIKKF